MPLAIGAAAGNLPVPAKETASTSRAQPLDHSSPAALCQSILDAVEHPDIGKYLQANSEKAAENRIDAIVRFQSSDEFTVFSRNMQQCLNELQTGQFGGENCDHYEKLAKNLELSDKSAGRTFYGPTLYDMYGFGCLHLKQVLALLKFAQASLKDVPLTALEDCRPIVKNLEEELLACGPGFLQKSETILTTLKHALFPPKLTEQIDHLRLQTAQQYLGQAMNDLFAHDPVREGNHVHMVKAWMQTLAPELGIKADQFDDVYANTSLYVDDVSQLNRDRITNELKTLITDSRLFSVLSQDVLEEVRHKLAPLSPAERKDVNGMINKVMQPLKARFGELKESALFKDLQVGEEILQAMHNPALLMAELRDKMAKEIQPKTNPGLEFLRIELDASSKQHLCIWGNALWTETTHARGTERALVCFDDIPADTAKRIVQQLRSNVDSSATAGNFLAELFSNHPDFNHCFPPSVMDVLDAQTIALLCAYTNHEAASAFRGVFDYFSVSKGLKPEQLFEAIRESRLTLEQIDTALTHIHDNKEKLINNRANFSWENLQDSLILEVDLTVDEQVFRLVMGKTHPDRSVLLNVISDAATSGKTEWLNLLIDAPDYSGEEKAQLAKDALKRVDVFKLHADALECLLSFNPVVKQEGPHDINLLQHFLAKSAPDELTCRVAIACKNKDDINFKDELGYTPLLLAAGAHLPKTVQALLDNTNIARALKDNQGDSALLIAVKTAAFIWQLNEEGFLNTCDTLLKAGFSANVESEYKKTPLLYALEGSLKGPVEAKLVKWLIDHGAHDIVDDNGYNAISIACRNLKPETMKVLLESEKFAVHKDTLHHLFATVEDSSTMASVLSHSVKRMNTYKLLLAHEFSIDRQNDAGKTAIDVAIENKHFDFAVAAFEDEPTLNVLNDEGFTRLHLAVIDKKYELVKVLVDAGAKINAKSSDAHSNQTAFDFALINQDRRMQTLLRDLAERR